MFDPSKSSLRRRIGSKAPHKRACAWRFEAEMVEIAALSRRVQTNRTGKGEEGNGLVGSRSRKREGGEKREENEGGKDRSLQRMEGGVTPRGRAWMPHPPRGQGASADRHDEVPRGTCLVRPNRNGTRLVMERSRQQIVGTMAGCTREKDAIFTSGECLATRRNGCKSNLGRRMHTNPTDSSNPNGARSP